ncbi:MAG: type VI secretion system tip protein VgrG [Gammaproteobacteria bacterium]|nr:type VI secretion system tip protein VgrG [Gammaproteobacteria bacterium]
MLILPKKYPLLSPLVLYFCLVTFSTFASEVKIPHVFSKDTKAVADEVNQNFSALQAGTNNNWSRILQLQQKALNFNPATSIEQQMQESLELDAQTDIIQDFHLDREAIKSCEENNSAIATVSIGDTKYASVQSIMGGSKLNELYQYTIQFETDQVLIIDDMIAQRASFNINIATTSGKFQGMIVAFAKIDSRKREDQMLHLYSATIAPVGFNLKLYSGFRAYTENRSSEVITQMFNMRGVSSTVAQTAVSYETIMQFNETDLNFVQRLSEREGMYFYFDQDGDNERVFVGSGPTTGKNIEGEFSYYGRDGQNRSNSTHIYSLGKRVNQHSLSAKISGFDYIGKTIVDSQVQLSNGSGVQSYYRSDVFTQEIADIRANNLKNQIATAANQVFGSSNIPLLKAGHKLNVNDQSGAGLGGILLLSEVKHVLIKNETNCLVYSNNFSAVPDNIAYMPTKLKQAPRFYGALNTIVTNISDPDNLMRIKVKFPWANGNIESGWIRIALPVGKLDSPDSFNYRPNVDDEVLISFINGDPERPIAIGALFNGVDRPPK